MFSMISFANTSGSGVLLAAKNKNDLFYKIGITNRRLRLPNKNTNLLMLYLKMANCLSDIIFYL